MRDCVRETGLVKVRRDVRYGETRILTSQQVYDEKGNLAAVQNMRHNGTSVASHVYTVDALNRRTDAVREDGTNWVYTYNDRSEVTTAQKRNGSTPLAGLRREYLYDNMGNRTSAKEGGDGYGNGLRTITYSRNVNNQYTTIARTSRAVDFTGTSTQNSSDLTVNDVYPLHQGAWWRAEVAPLNSQAWAEATIKIDGQPVDDGARLQPAYPLTTTLSYDPDGNLTYDGRNYYAWDAEQRLAVVYTPAYSTIPPNASTPVDVRLAYKIEFTYDALGRRIQKFVYRLVGSLPYPVSIEHYLYDGWNLAGVWRAVDPSNSVTAYSLHQAYVWGPDVSGTLQGAGGVGGLLMSLTGSGNNWTAQHYCYDGNGNVTAQVQGDAGSAITAQYDYDPFGNPIRATGPKAEENPFRFSTKFTDDESGLVYYGYRYYHPAMGRWLSRDPIEEAGGVNLYGFCENGMMNRVDRLGLDVLSRKTYQFENTVAARRIFYII